MRRTDREITDRAEMDDTIRRCQVCHLGLCDDGRPYVVPMSFGYDGERLVFHGAAEGRKVDILKKNDRVCAEFEIVGDLITGDMACGWSVKYESAIVFGRARILEDLEAKREALACLTRRHSDRTWDFPEAMLARTLVFTVEIEDVTGKKRD